MKDMAKPARPDPIAYLTGRLNAPAPRPPGISLPGEGGKFASDGSVQHWPGNTFVCHVVPDSAAHDLIRAIQEEVKMSRFARFFTFLPPSSFHMTVFQGVSPETGSPDALPRGAVPGMRRDALSGMMLDAIRDLAFDPAPKARLVELFCGYSLTVTGAEPGGEAPFRAMRETLRDATGIMPPDFDSYVFHITLAYLVDWLTEPVARDLVAFSAGMTDRYAPRLAEIPLGPVAFCTFETMHHFEPLKALV